MPSTLVSTIPLIPLSATAVAFFTHPVDGPYIAVVGLLVTMVTKIASEALTRRNDRRRDEQRHKWEREDRAQNRADVKAELAETQRKLDENTALTIKSTQASERAIDISNHQNEKLIRLTEKLGQSDD